MLVMHKPKELQLQLQFARWGKPRCVQRGYPYVYMAQADHKNICRVRNGCWEKISILLDCLLTCYASKREVSECVLGSLS